MEADPHYFRGAPKIRQIQISIVPNYQTLLTLWQTQQLDYAVVRSNAGIRALDVVRAVAGTQVVLRTHAEFDFVLFNQMSPALRELAVRRAIVQAIDRRAIMSELAGELWVTAEGDRTPGQFAYDPTLRQPAYDPAAAMRTLEAAGWRLENGARRKNGVALQLEMVSTTESPMQDRFDLIVQQQLARVGIGISLRSYAYNIMWAAASEGGIYRAGRFDLSFSGWQPNGVNDHSYLFRCDTRPPAGDNLSRLCDPQIDAAAREELGTADPQREAEADRAITRRLVEQSDILFLGFNREAVAYNASLAGIAPAYTGLHLWNAWEWRWK
ncbi:MAG: hypothetical protein JO101_04995 [Candidatus Eremiobacteraeota bacterium]|nr:hypothetical protein [Candidatus Eremiobacteraeota bacterium]